MINKTNSTLTFYITLKNCIFLNYRNFVQRMPKSTLKWTFRALYLRTKHLRSFGSTAYWFCFICEVVFLSCSFLICKMGGIEQDRIRGLSNLHGNSSPFLFSKQMYFNTISCLPRSHDRTATVLFLPFTDSLPWSTLVESWLFYCSFSMINSLHGIPIFL